jgi:hypothetical protein
VGPDVHLWTTRTGSKALVVTSTLTLPSDQDSRSERQETHA